MSQITWTNITYLPDGTVDPRCLPWGEVRELQTDKGLAYFMDHSGEWWTKDNGQVFPAKYIKGDPHLFTLDDMKDCYSAGWVAGGHDDTTQEDAYFKNKFNIEL